MHRAVPPFLVLAFAALTACGGSRATVEVAANVEVPAPPPVPMRAPESLLPPTAPVVFRIDLASLRASAHYGAVQSSLAAAAESEGASELLSLAERTEEIWGAMVPGSNGQMAPVLVARGSYTLEDARQIVASAETPATPGTRAGFTVYYREQVAFSLIGDHTIVIGERAAVDGAVDLQESGGGAGPTDPVVTAGMERIGFRQAGAALAMRMTESIYAELELPPMLYSSLESAAAGITVDEGIHGAVVVRTSGSFVAGTLVTLGRSQLAEARREPQIEALGLAPLLNGITLSSEGPEAWARLEIAGADLAALVSSLSAMLLGATAP